METAIYEIKFLDGRIYRIFCANGTQKDRCLKAINDIKHLIENWMIIVNGIHTVSQWEKQVNFELK